MSGSLQPACRCSHGAVNKSTLRHCVCHLLSRVSYCMQAMQQVMSNPSFMNIAEKFGAALMQVSSSFRCVVVFSVVV